MPSTAHRKTGSDYAPNQRYPQQCCVAYALRRYPDQKRLTEGKRLGFDMAH